MADSIKRYFFSVICICIFLIRIKSAPLSESDSDDADQTAEHFEGDIVGIDGEFLSQSDLQSLARAVDTESMKWPEAVVPFEIRKGVYNDKRIKEIHEALGNIMDNTCVRFRERTNEDEDYIRIVEGLGCSSNVGRTGNQQIVTLQKSGCREFGHILHVIMHALGFYHEQSRTDRDKYVDINWTNVPEDHHKDFQTYSGNDFNLPPC
jgi:hypothetical protein